MEWEKQLPQQAEELNDGGGGGGIFVKVMTDEQMEVLRKQIAVYVAICEQLVELHKSLTSQNDLAGVGLGNIYCDPLITSGAHKIPGRHRWTPTPMQLQILENIFNQETGSISKPRIQEITTELLQHGRISEMNVYNWFQNRRARSKRKQRAAPVNNAESEVETEVESLNEKTKLEDFQTPHILSLSTEDLRFQTLSIHSVDPGTGIPEPSSTKIGGSFGQVPFYGSMVLNPRMDQLIGKMEVPGNYNPCLQQDGYNMAG